MGAESSIAAWLRIRGLMDQSDSSPMVQCNVLRSFVRCPLMGRPVFLFIGQGKAWVTVEGKEENEKEKKSYRIIGSFFSFTRVPPTL